MRTGQGSLPLEGKGDRRTAVDEVVKNNAVCGRLYLITRYAGASLQGETLRVNVGIRPYNPAPTLS